MRQAWLYMLLFAVTCVFAATVEAQRFPQVLNMHTHGGKYSTGGVGLTLGGGSALSSDLTWETQGSDFIGGDLEAIYIPVQRQAISRFTFGLGMDLQIGSNSDLIGTDFALRLYNVSLSTTATGEGFVTEIDESATLIYAGFNFTLNFYKSEFIEADGRRTRQDWGLAMIFGPKASLMMGDFADLNGLSSFGLDVGVMADFPIPIGNAEDLLTISPYLWFEMNYRLNVDNGITAPANSDTPGQDLLNGNFDVGFFNRSQIVADRNDDAGLAVRRHNFIPAYAINLGADANLTPIFLSRTGGTINNWQFKGSLVITVPLDLGFFASDHSGDALASDGEYPIHFTISFGASYFF
jgi:hypothetical protein